MLPSVFGFLDQMKFQDQIIFLFKPKLKLSFSLYQFSFLEFNRYIKENYCYHNIRKSPFEQHLSQLNLNVSKTWLNFSLWPCGFNAIMKLTPPKSKSKVQVKAQSPSPSPKSKSKSGLTTGFSSKLDFPACQPGKFKKSKIQQYIQTKVVSIC